MTVKAKKHLGQHFLTDENIAYDIVKALSAQELHFKHVLEIGPGMGVLTKYLIEREDIITHVVDIDVESIAWLEEKYPVLHGRIVSGDFLKLPIDQLFDEPVAIIGNFPYNISSQIMFKVLEHKNQIPMVVGMFQKEVAQRLAAGPGGRDYGILSVFLQAFYDIEYLFSVPPHVFNPPPQVNSGVIRCVRNQNQTLGCEEYKFVSVVKMAFNQRRKTLRNALKPLLSNLKEPVEVPYLDLRAEALSWQQFVELTLLLT